MPNTAKPTVTDEHKKKYEAIMGTPVRPSVTPAQTTPQPAQTNKNPSAISSLIASLPKIKGIGNKMFIFTGKKKIIMDGTKREVEDIKTVDPKPQEKLVKKVEEKPEKILSEKELVAKNVPTEIVQNKNEEKQKQVPQKAPVAKAQTENKITKKKLITILASVAGLVFIFAWTFFWLVFFEYVKF